MMTRTSRTGLLAIVVWLAATAAGAQVAPEWRIGYEWNENWPWSPAWTAPSHDDLLDALSAVAPGGGINVNGLGNWAQMQPFEGAAIRFQETDPVVRLFQRHGYELVWYLRPTAHWAWVDPNVPGLLASSMAPAPDKEDDWQEFVRAVVERYDGDGVQDMPGLTRPVRFFVLDGEIFFNRTGAGDTETEPFWADTIDNLLRLHRLTYQALHEADPSGQTQLVGSGAVLWDLYADFPDYPEFDPGDPNSVLRRRLRGENFRGVPYTAGWAALKKMLASFGDDGDGIECDLIGWHPHFHWRTTDQEFQLIRSLAGDKPIFVDDMWTNLFPVGYGTGLPPGEAQFHATAAPSRDWVSQINGDFPNSLFTSEDPYGELFSKLAADDPATHAWYQGHGARRLTKSLATTLGEGAAHVSISGGNDTDFFTTVPWEIGWINVVGTLQEGYPEKAQSRTLRLLRQKLAGFTHASRVAAGSDPRTRVYRFERPQGPLWIAWSETGPAPPALDYTIPTGETVTFPVPATSLVRTRIPTATSPPFAPPAPATVASPGGTVTLQLGYEPVLLEIEKPAPCVATSSALCLNEGRFRVEVEWSDPFNGGTGSGESVPLTADTGAFWFFSSSNIELVVKVLDGRSLNGNFWVFYGSLTNVEFTLNVTDTETGAIATYHNPPFQFASRGDTTAFPPLAAGSAVASVTAAAATPATPWHAAPAHRISTGPTLATGTCQPSETALCLSDSRFQLEVSWRDPFNGGLGVGHAIAQTGDTGTFWFFNPANTELIVKVLDGRPLNGHFWVFYGSLTNVEFTLQVTDSETGAVATYRNPPFQFASRGDTAAFALP